MGRRIAGGVVLLLLGISFLHAQPWKMNTLPGPGHYDHKLAEGAGWDHTENIVDLSVSPADPNLRAFIENEWTTVITEDGVNFRPLRMPHIGTPGCSPMSIEFSRYDPSCIYLLLANDHWRSMDPGTSPAGLWRSPDLGESWEHIYTLPEGGYEEFSNSSGGNLILEDPCSLRSGYLYLASTSNGLLWSGDGGQSWESLVEELSDWRIKTLSAGTFGEDKTVIYAIADRKMPRHVIGEKVPVDIGKAASDYTARWKFDKNLDDYSDNGNTLTGSVAGWNESAAENSYAANFNGSNALAIGKLSADKALSKFTISAWAKTTDSARQVIASFDRNQYWELGIRDGAPVFSVFSPVEDGLPGVSDTDTIGFSAAEAYLPGSLADHSEWNGSTVGFTVDTAEGGSVLQDGINYWQSLRYTRGLPAEDIYSLGVTFSFNRSKGGMDAFRRIMRFGLLDTLSGKQTTLELRRQASPSESYSLWGVNPGTENRWPGSANFDESLLGFDDESDSVSDVLQMNLVYVRGSDLSNWTARYELRNLTRNTLVMLKDAGSFDVPAEFAEAELVFYLSSADSDSDGQVSRRRIYNVEYGTASEDTGDNDSDGKIIEVSGMRIDDGDWHHIAGVFDGGLLQIYVDGERMAGSFTGNTAFGSGNTRYGFLGFSSQSGVPGDMDTIAGTGFRGSLDDVRLFSARAFSRADVEDTYLERNRKCPVVQGQLWRIIISSSGEVEETRRLHAPAEDFFQVEVNPGDPSRGWFIRKANPNGFPYGGRELFRFTDYGESMSESDVELGGSSCFREIKINPGMDSHLYLALGGSYREGLRYSKDGGATWLGTDRAVGDVIPGLQSWTAHDYLEYKEGFPAELTRESIGQPMSFVPGVPNELLYIVPKKGGLMRSLDYGESFESYATGGPLKDIGQIAVAPNHPEYWGISVYEQGYSVTHNNGLKWRGASYENNPELLRLTGMAEAAGDWWTAARTAGGIAFDPEDPAHMIATWTRQAYIVRSTDGGLNWSYTGTRSSGLGHLDVFWKPAMPDRVYAGTMRSDDGGESWTGMGKVVISVCESNPDIIVGVDDVFRKVDAGSLGMHVSLDGGLNWTNLPDPPAEAVPGKTGTSWEVTKFRRKWNCAADAMVAIDPRSSCDPTLDEAGRLRILMAGRSGIYEYNAPDRDGSGSESDWQINSGGLENNPHYGSIEPVPWMGFVLFDPRPGYEHIAYAATQNDDATLGRWSEESNKNHSYPGGNNFEPFYMSEDGGITWEKMHGADFPNAPESAMIESMSMDTNGRLFAASTEGIYLIAVEGIAYSLFNLEYSGLTHNSLELNWSLPVDSASVAAYLVFQDGVRVDSVPGSVHATWIGQLESNTAYVFRAKAVNDSAGIIAVSNALTLRTTLPGGPELSLAYSNLGHSTVDLNWVASGDTNWVAAYVVYQDGVPVDTLAANSNYSGMEGLTSSTTYEYMLKALDASGHVIAVSQNLVLTTAVITGPGLSLGYENITSGSVDLVWIATGDQSGVDRYVVYRDGWPVDTVGSAVFRYFAGGLNSGSEYYFTIRALSVSGQVIAVTGLSSVTTLLETGKESPAVQDQTILPVPNPAELSFQLINAGRGRLRICSPDGKVVWLGMYEPGVPVDVSELAPGIYLLELESDSRTRHLLRIEN